MNDNLLTIQEVASKLKVHWQTVRSHISSGDLPATKIGRTVRIKESDLNNFISNQSPKQINEIELRFITINRQIIEQKLLEMGAKIVYHGHIIDHWFIPKTIKNIEQKNEWFDTGIGFGLRIREQDNGYTGKMTATLEVKRLVEPYKHETCIEQEIDIASYNETAKLLNLMEFKEMTTLDKDRLVYKYHDFKIAIDDIKGFKTGIEIELMTSENPKKVLPKIQSLADQIGLDVKKEIAEKSVTYEYMLTNARF